MATEDTNGTEQNQYEIPWVLGRDSIYMGEPDHPRYEAAREFMNDLEESQDKLMQALDTLYVLIGYLNDDSDYGNMAAETVAKDIRKLVSAAREKSDSFETDAKNLFIHHFEEKEASQ